MLTNNLARLYIILVGRSTRSWHFRNPHTPHRAVVQQFALPIYASIVAHTPRVEEPAEFCRVCDRQLVGGVCPIEATVQSRARMGLV